ncbi:hypothetical protein GCM10010508_62590 [Streptomyces naganishii JCM 4654]|uniref:Uncharacterized protein n=1 Tax=Streptomyces naganishii JCM 4654 TaxID=1306179 RepID=A0A918Y9M5_9ACTN|nr:hypothetical protein GCM10010508_62590 [Streptomyces naganishii JCM 4654]
MSTTPEWKYTGVEADPRETTPDQAAACPKSSPEPRPGSSSQVEWRPEPDLNRKRAPRCRKSNA